MRDAVDDDVAQAEQRHQQEQRAGDEDRAERRLPRVAHAEHHDIGEIGIEAHAWRQARSGSWHRGP